MSSDTHTHAPTTGKAIDGVKQLLELNAMLALEKCPQLNKVVIHIGQGGASSCTISSCLGHCQLRCHKVGLHLRCSARTIWRVLLWCDFMATSRIADLTYWSLATMSQYDCTPLDFMSLRHASAVLHSSNLNCENAFCFTPWACQQHSTPHSTTTQTRRRQAEHGL